MHRWIVSPMGSWAFLGQPQEPHEELLGLGASLWASLIPKTFVRPPEGSELGCVYIYIYISCTIGGATIKNNPGRTYDSN